MNDNNFEEELFEEEEVLETEKKKSNPEKTIKIILGAVIVALIVVVVLAALLLGSKSGNDETTTIPEETTTLVSETTTSPEEKYTPGQYTVNVGANGTLRHRKDATKDAEIVNDIPNGTLLTVTEVKYDATAEEGSQYWGKTVYLGWDGWVSMTYLANAYSESVVTPAEQTTAPENTTEGEETTAAAPEQTTSASEQTTAAPEQTTAAPETTTSASNAGSAYATGKYTVDAQPHLNMRDGHSVDALAIAQIPDKSEITIDEVYYDANSTDSYTKYWGKTTFGGVTGWVAMGYLD
ncbi:MAG: hypothetical protein IKL10_04485 [Clostridia bacterium]|nr:hypothetical protein [Clostridia bacterium]